MIYYKLVEINYDGDYVSYVIEDPDIAVTYDIGKKVVAKIEGTPLFVFKAKEYISDFCRGEKPSNAAILECECEEFVTSLQSHLQMLQPFFVEGNETLVKTFWTSPKEYKRYTSATFPKYKGKGFVTNLIPKGTVFVSSLTPIRIVDASEVFSEKTGDV